MSARFESEHRVRALVDDMSLAHLEIRNGSVIIGDELDVTLAQTLMENAAMLAGALAYALESHRLKDS